MSSSFQLIQERDTDFQGKPTIEELDTYHLMNLYRKKN